MKNLNLNHASSFELWTQTGILERKKKYYSSPRSILISFSNVSFDHIVVIEFGLGLGGGSYADG